MKSLNSPSRPSTTIRKLIKDTSISILKGFSKYTGNSSNKRATCWPGKNIYFAIRGVKDKNFWPLSTLLILSKKSCPQNAFSNSLLTSSMFSLGRNLWRKRPAKPVVSKRHVKSSQRVSCCSIFTCKFYKSSCFITPVSCCRTSISCSC